MFGSNSQNANKCLVKKIKKIFQKPLTNETFCDIIITEKNKGVNNYD